MKSMIKRISIGAVTAALLLSATACAQLAGGLDVIGKGSVVAFEKVLLAAPEQLEADAANGGWSLSAPDDTARFIWSGDWSKSPRYDVMLAMDAAPFLNAGLDPKKLPEQYAYDGDTLMVGTKLGTKPLEYDAGPAPLAAYAQIVKLEPGSIGYHGAMDHYGVNLGSGNMFEWAKDIEANDKDMVFVLDPEALIAAGVDPNRVEGWAFAKVKVHSGGKLIEVDKLLKPFNLK